jgi:hypothetical protein
MRTKLFQLHKAYNKHALVSIGTACGDEYFYCPCGVFMVRENCEGNRQWVVGLARSKFARAWTPLIDQQPGTVRRDWAAWRKRVCKMGYKYERVHAALGPDEEDEV